MAAWRCLGSSWLMLATASLAWGQNYNLRESLTEETCAHYHLEMKLVGEMHIVQEDRPGALKLAASAVHDFDERLLIVANGTIAQKAARVYDAAKATIEVGKERSERSLRPERSLAIVQRPRDLSLVYSPKGPLSGEEVELTSGHFDTLALFGLLPGKAVALKETWKIPSETVQGLAHLEGVTSHDLVGKLEEVKGDIAVVSVNGSVAGIDLGAMVKMKVEASYRFDIKAGCLLSADWKEKDARGQGPASPASNVETSYTVKRTRIDVPERLTDVAIISVPAGLVIPPELMLLAYRDPKNRYGFKYAREWQIVSQTDEHLVMRLLDRGEFISQVTITPWASVKAGEHMTPEEFRRTVGNTPGWDQTEVRQAGEVATTEKGRWIYRVTAIGQMDGMELLQNFYLIAGPKGNQFVLAFTVTPALAERLGSRDLDIVHGIELPTE